MMWLPKVARRKGRGVLATGEGAAPCAAHLGGLCVDIIGLVLFGEATADALGIRQDEACHSCRDVIGAHVGLAGGHSA